jgi:hypothetical protein
MAKKLDDVVTVQNDMTGIAKIETQIKASRPDKLKST